MLFCHVTSRVTDDPYQSLLQEKGGRGFPYLVWLDADGNVLAPQGDRSVAGFDKTRKALAAYAELLQKAAQGDKGAAIDALIAGLELGKFPVDEAKVKIAELGEIPAEKQKALDAMLVNLEVEAALQGVRSQDQVVKVGRQFLEMEQAGRIPTGRAAWSFYGVMLEVHAADKDAEAYEKKLGVLKKLVEGERGAARMLKRAEDTLEKLKKGDG